MMHKTAEVFALHYQTKLNSPQFEAIEFPKQAASVSLYTMSGFCVSATFSLFFRSQWESHREISPLNVCWHRRLPFGTLTLVC